MISEVCLNLQSGLKTEKPQHFILFVSKACPLYAKLEVRPVLNQQNSNQYTLVKSH